MKSFKSTASKIENPRFFFNKSPDVIYNEPPPANAPYHQGGMHMEDPCPKAPLVRPCTKGAIIIFFRNNGIVLDNSVRSRKRPIEQRTTAHVR